MDENNRKQNKLILFDWGNIVESHKTGYSCLKAWEKLFKKCGYNYDIDTEKLTKYRLSAITDEESFEKVFYMIKKDFKLNVNYNEFIKYYYECFNNIEYYKNVKDYEISLKNKCYIGIFSNLLMFDKERLDKQVELINYDYVFLSFELGYRKPEIEIYKKVQNQLPFSKENILFIDDKIDNIKSAKKMGWNTLCASGLELNKIKEVCEKFLN